MSETNTDFWGKFPTDPKDGAFDFGKFYDSEAGKAASQRFSDSVDKWLFEKVYADMRAASEAAESE